MALISCSEPIHQQSHIRGITASQTHVQDALGDLDLPNYLHGILSLEDDVDGDCGSIYINAR